MGGGGGRDRGAVAGAGRDGSVMFPSPVTLISPTSPSEIIYFT